MCPPERHTSTDVASCLHSCALPWSCPGSAWRGRPRRPGTCTAGSAVPECRRQTCWTACASGTVCSARSPSAPGAGRNPAISRRIDNPHEAIQITEAWRAHHLAGLHQQAWRAAFDCKKQRLTSAASTCALPTSLTSTCHARMFVPRFSMRSCPTAQTSLFRRCQDKTGKRPCSGRPTSAGAHLECQDGRRIRSVTDDWPQHKGGVDGDEVEALCL